MWRIVLFTELIYRKIVKQDKLVLLTLVSAEFVVQHGLQEDWNKMVKKTIVIYLHSSQIALESQFTK